MAFACRYCIMTKGLQGSEISALPQTQDELVTHIECEHHIPVRRKGETADQARERLWSAYPEARDLRTCKCPACVRDRDQGI